MVAREAKLTGSVDVLKGADPAAARRFKVLAYTGAEFDRLYGKAVADLSGFDVPAKLPMLVNHDDDVQSVAGYADKATMTERGLELEGPLSTATAGGKLVAQLSDEGFPLKASIGVRIHKSEALTEGQTAKCNGRDVSGPMTIWRKVSLFETSFVTANPADKNTTAAALAEEKPMTADEFLKANPDAVKAWKDEAAKAERLAMTGRLDALLKEIGDRPLFVLEQFKAGADVRDAKAALCDVLRAEKAAPAPTPAPAGNTVLDALKAKAGNPGMGFDGKARQDASAEQIASLPPLERAKAEFAADPNLARFTTVENLAACYRAEATGQVNVNTIARAASVLTGAV